MCTSIQTITSTSRTFVFEGRTQKCHHCQDGQQRHWTDTCTPCKGKGKIPKGGRNFKCKTCTGNGYVSLAVPKIVGTCPYCKGTQLLPITAYDTMNEEEKLWIFENLFNFEKPYTKSYSTFNEEYLGFKTVVGVTDYGRYQSMSPAEFKEEVKKTFLRSYGQYVSVLKDGKLPIEILIRKGENGWHAYPIFEESK